MFIWFYFFVIVNVGVFLLGLDILNLYRLDFVILIIRLLLFVLSVFGLLDVIMLFVVLFGLLRFIVD